MNKRKIINDPVYGFISIASDLLYDLVDHPYFQRLRRIRQLGLADIVYPGALHTRFHHALGAMHLMSQALRTLQEKGHMIWEPESEGAQAAILLHDLGHGPFSHVLESVVLPGVPHEAITLVMMKDLNRQLNGRLDIAIQMFEGKYPRKFYHQMISSQLDMDRMDYLNRDSFYTGVIEGSIGADRLIKMLDISHDQLVVEEKGLLSIENFLHARRLMYWQVYLHKTLLSAQAMLTQILHRARELAAAGEQLFATPDFARFLYNRFTLADFDNEPDLLAAFNGLDDNDVWASVKGWKTHSDPVLSTLCQMLLDRNLFKISFFNEPPGEEVLAPLRERLTARGISETDMKYFLITGETTNWAYAKEQDPIRVKMKKGNLLDIADASDIPTIEALTKIVRKYYVCWAKNVSLRG
ncbi:HD superfamily phosphohydrolase [Dyadobacter sp. BE34]|uniref:HD superfamily phosphohydrolase n=1 Tax=Dyadobacter fermentans TaxID=94254 RepID=A0ABU1R5E9_9BACT|nr:HD superfamily phosphohydrolase [Dyadobacter fermentans]MDR7046009.1 HD superfamily phosphohydrolase [Dyadobacter sp. BE242]MDR7200322.1 HD superfamily phosphohydrolase [Dyadobacter sp. BE34]MDR7218282.1 HD superfamily phosphohydrolase [Dyadobacter sp. BE31]MDR7266213.1 HD superfamily phosphohydrolase [Dyadobacter sp. BE32]